MKYFLLIFLFLFVQEKNELVGTWKRLDIDYGYDRSITLDVLNKQIFRYIKVGDSTISIMHINYYRDKIDNKKAFIISSLDKKESDTAFYRIANDTLFMTFKNFNGDETLKFQRIK